MQLRADVTSDGFSSADIVSDPHAILWQSDRKTKLNILGVCVCAVQLTTLSLLYTF